MRIFTMTTQSILPVGGTAGSWRGDLRETSRLEALVARLQHRWAAYQTYRQTVEELQLLSDRDLDDIGVARCDIRMIAREAAEAVLAGRARTV
jgi:uncharacterized protein YjiS (DUF1127 family)